MLRDVEALRWWRCVRVTRKRPFHHIHPSLAPSRSLVYKDIDWARKLLLQLCDFQDKKAVQPHGERFNTGGISGVRGGGSGSLSRQLIAPCCDDE